MVPNVGAAGAFVGAPGDKEGEKVERRGNAKCTGDEGGIFHSGIHQ